MSKILPNVSGLVGPAILVTACGSSDTPVPTTRVQDTPSAPAAVPTSTPVAAPTAATQAATATPSSTLAPECAGLETSRDTTADTSSLLEALEVFPLSLKGEGFWYGDYRRALSGFPWQGVKAHMQSYAEEWPDVLGIEHFQVDLSASPGESVAPREPAYLEGAFDADLVKTKLLELGYEEQESSGRTYYSIRQDHQTNLRDPRHLISLSSMNRVYITDDILIASPYTEFMTTMLDTMDGAVEFLAEDPAFSILAESLGDPLGAVLMDRPTVMNPVMQGAICTGQAAEVG